MKIFSFILFLTTAAMVTTSCEPAHKGAYEAPANTISNNGEMQFEGDPSAKIDSSVEKAIMKDSTTKRNYHL